MSVLKRPPGDIFTYRLFFQLANKIKKPKNSFYLWSGAIDPSFDLYHVREDLTSFNENEMYYRDLLINEISAEVVVIGIKDHLTSGNFNPWFEQRPVMVEYLNDLANFYSDKKVVYLTSLENLEYYINAPNASIVPWGGDITNQQLEYKSLQPVLDKNFDSPYVYISLNRNKRSHRAVLVSLLLALGLDRQALISCMFSQQVSNVLAYANWQFTPEQAHIKELIEEGSQRLPKHQFVLNDDERIYPNENNDNVHNFKDKLSVYYTNTFVEIVSETSYTEKCFLITEKVLNSIYGCNFPIILSSQGCVGFLRDMGLDVFDDVIDHSYDLIENPIDRLYTAITKNQELLTNSERTKQLWKERADRFAKNVELVKSQMYNYYADRAKEQFNKIADEINGDL